MIATTMRTPSIPRKRKTEVETPIISSFAIDAVTPPLELPKSKCAATCGSALDLDAFIVDPQRLRHRDDDDRGTIVDKIRRAQEECGPTRRI